MKFGFDFECSYILNYGNGSRKWDFNTKPFNPKQVEWGNETHFNNISTHGIYIPFQSSIDANRNPGELIAEADGLRFVAEANCFGYNNPGVDHYVKNKKGEDVKDESKDKNCETRYICLKAGSKVIIPSSIFKDFSRPRVRIKMNRVDQTNSALQMIINNAMDAEGKEFKQDNGFYGIGGCTWWGADKGDYLYRGEYHFQIKDPTKDFSMEFPSWHEDNTYAWLLLYTIEVYDSDEMITENSILDEDKHYQFLTTRFTNENGTVTNSVSPASGNYHLHYRGKTEQSYLTNCTVSGTVGTLGNKTGEDFYQRFVRNASSSDTRFIYTPVEGEFGSFRIRLDVHDLNNKYVTDYAYRTMSAGLMENKQYPYTWDFTDVEKYKNSTFKDDKGVETLGDNKMDVESTIGYAEQLTPDYVKGITYIPRNVWDEDGAFRIAHDAGHNVLFAGGSQLWYGTTIIPETAGLAFTPVNYDGAYNGAMTLTNNGLLFNQAIRDWWLWRIMIPQVDNKCTIYVRARKLTSDELAGDTYYNVGYYYGDATNNTEKSKFSTAALTSTAAAREIATDGDDVIYAIPAPSQTTNVTLFFNGVEVHKIAVSKDPKTVNKYGWATESRDRVIDQELTSYFTGKDFVTYLVDEVNSSNTSVKLSDVTMTSNVMEKSNGSDYNAYIIRNKDAEILKDEDGNVVKDENDEVVATGKVDILNTGGGFHLFVPDIHDYVKIGENTSTYNQKSVNTYKPLLKAKLNSGPVNKNETIDGVDYTNFVLTWQVADITEGQQGSQYDFENVGFFRVQDAGIQSKGNQGYLPLILASGNTTNKYNIVWDDDTNGIDATITDNVARRSDNVFYNLSGQRLNGVPTKGGIYIVNGKKIVVK